MIRILQIIMLIILANGALLAQQQVQFSQYFRNAQTFNPAVTGIDDFVSIKTGYRAQWTGFDGAPKTYFLTAEGNFGKPEPRVSYRQNSLRVSDPSIYDGLYTEDFKNVSKHAIGGYLIADSFGPFDQYFGYASYAYHIALNENVALALGASGGISHLTFDANDIQVRLPDDVTYDSFIAEGSSKTNFDVNAGAFLYSENFYLGYSAGQLLQQKIFIEGNTEEDKLNINHFAMAGYKIGLGAFFDLTPGVLVKYVEPVPVAVDMNLKLSYNDLLWGGVTYRNEDAFIGMIGFNLKDQFNISYSYDYNTSDLGSYNSGSHEVVLGLMLGNKEKSTPYFW